MQYKKFCFDDLALCQTVNYLLSSVIFVFLLTDLSTPTVFIMFLVNVALNFINGSTYRYFIKIRMHKRQNFELRIETISFFISLAFIALPLLIYNASLVDLLFIFLGQTLIRLLLFRGYLRKESFFIIPIFSGIYDLIGRTKIEAIRMLTIALYRQIPSLLVGVFMGTKTLGFYNRSGFLGEQITSIVTKTFNYLLLREVSLSKETKNFVRLDRKFSIYVIIAMPLFYLCSIPVAKVIVNIMGAGWAEIEILICICLTIVPLKVLNFSSIQILKASGDYWFIPSINIVSILFLITAMFFSKTLVTFCWMIMLDSVIRKVLLSYFLRRNYRSNLQKS